MKAMTYVTWMGGKTPPALQRYVSSSFTQHLFERQSEIDQALKAYIDEEMAKVAAPVSVEKIEAAAFSAKHCKYFMNGAQQNKVCPPSC